MSHTPGPWRIASDDKWSVLGDKGTMPLIATASARDVRKQAQANARLIAAAPILLAACQAVVDAWHEEDTNFTKEEPAALKLCREALAQVKT